MTTQFASALAALITAIVGIAGWQLSTRAQRSEQHRRQALDQGPYVESLQGWSREIVAWYREQTERLQKDCREEMRQQRVACDERVRQARRAADYWKDRALGRKVSDDTPPDDV